MSSCELIQYNLLHCAFQPCAVTMSTEDQVNFDSYKMNAEVKDYYMCVCVCTLHMSKENLAQRIL